MNVAERISVYGVRGAETCSIEELMEIVAGKQQEIGTFHDLEILLETLSPARKTRLIAAMELFNRLDRKKEVKVIHGPEDVFKYAYPYFRGLMQEHFSVMLLNTKNHILGIENISVGSLTASIVHPREVFAKALNKCAAAIILLHNHPSGDPTPSREDIQVTTRMVKAGKVMDIPVLDHVILGDNQFTSLKEKGMLHE